MLHLYRLGMVCLEAVNLVHNALIGVGLRDQIRIIASGKTASSFDLLEKIAIGADLVNAARTMMLALGCVQSKQCNTNHCPTGIATQDPARSKAIDLMNKSERVKNFHHNTLASFYDLVGSMGLDDPAKLMPQMIKRRSPYGRLISVGSLSKPLTANALLTMSNIPENSEHSNDYSPWQHWWQSCSAKQFYVEDTFILLPEEIILRQ